MTDRVKRTTQPKGDGPRQARGWRNGPGRRAILLGILAVALSGMPSRARSLQVAFPKVLHEAKLIVVGRVDEDEYVGDGTRIPEGSDSLRIRVTDTLKGGDVTGSRIAVRVPSWGRRLVRDRMTRGTEWLFVVTGNDDILCIGREEGSLYRLEIPYDRRRGTGIVCTVDKHLYPEFTVDDDNPLRVSVDKRALRALVRDTVQIAMTVADGDFRRAGNAPVSATVVIRNTGEAPLLLDAGPGPFRRTGAAFRFVLYWDMNPKGPFTEPLEGKPAEPVAVLNHDLWGALRFEQDIDLASLLLGAGAETRDGFARVPAGGELHLAVDLRELLTDLLRTEGFPALCGVGVSFELRAPRWRGNSHPGLFTGTCSGNRVYIPIGE